MFKKYNDNLAAVVLGIFLLGIASYVGQLLFTTESWLAENGVHANAATITRVMGGAWLGLGIGLVLTFLNGPDGQKTYFLSLGVAQVSTLSVLAYSHFITKVPHIGDDVAIVTVLTVLMLLGWFRIKSRL